MNFAKFLRTPLLAASGNAFCIILIQQYTTFPAHKIIKINKGNKKVTGNNTQNLFKVSYNNIELHN